MPRRRRASVLFDLESSKEMPSIRHASEELPPVTPKEYVQLALRLVAAGETSHALRLLDEAFAIQSSGSADDLLSVEEHARWLLCAANWAIGEKAYPQAVQHCEKAAELHPNFLTLSGLAWSCIVFAQNCEDPAQRVSLERHCLEGFVEALQHWRIANVSADDVAPLATVVQMRVRAAVAHALCDQHDEAIAMLEELVADFALEPIACVLLATLHTARGSHERAFEVVSVVLEMYPNHILSSLVGAAVMHAMHYPANEVRSMIARTIKRMSSLAENGNSAMNLVSALPPPSFSEYSADASARNAAAVMFEECGCGDSLQLVETLYRCTCILLHVVAEIGDRPLASIAIEWATNFASQNASTRNWSRVIFGRILEVESRFLRSEGTTDEARHSAYEKLQVALQSSKSPECYSQLAEMALPPAVCNSNSLEGDLPVGKFNWIDIAVAEGYLQSALRMDPRNAVAQHLLGKCRLAIGDTAGAVEILLSAAANELRRPVVPFGLLAQFLE